MAGGRHVPLEWWLLKVRGFILQTTQRIERGRAIVCLYGKLEGGESFLVRVSRCSPYFYVPASAVPVPEIGLSEILESPPRVTMDGRAVAKVEFRSPGELTEARDRLRRAGVESFEADVRLFDRILIERSIRGVLEIEGEARPGSGIDLLFDDPVLRPSDWAPSLSVLSIDIETNPQANRLLSIALSGCGAAEVLLLTPPEMECPRSAKPCVDESELLRYFERRVRQLDPDVITGWNVIDFDLKVLLRRAEALGRTLKLGRHDGATRVVRTGRFRAGSRAFVTGRVVLDGIDLLRGAFVRMESYALNSVAFAVLGKKKTITGSDRAEEILRQFHEDRDALVEYNLNDANLVLEILDRLRLIPLTIERSRLTGLPPDRVSASIASFDFLYLTELYRRGVVAPTADSESTDRSEASGGHVLDPVPGLYQNVILLDFKSLYPSVIRTFQIDPLGYLEDASDDAETIVAPNGAAFRRRPGILPALLDELVPRRDAAKAAGDTVASQAIKILMNSFYGVLGASRCRFARPALANAITGFGREILLWAKQFIESRGSVVLYGDTDSLFVLSNCRDPAAARTLASDLVSDLNRSLAAEISRRYRVESRLEIEFERLYLRMLLPRARGSTSGARKRYAGLVEEDGNRTVVFTGMEVVRRDWTDLARSVQRELYERLFSDRPVESYLRSVVEDLREGRLDARLVYRKSLRKPLGDYTRSTPPHVAAARKLEQPPGRRISYVMTLGGAEPVEHLRSPIDHEHYVQKQIRPVAEPVLELVGLEFDRVIGDETQQSLF